MLYSIIPVISLLINFSLITAYSICYYSKINGGLKDYSLLVFELAFLIVPIQFLILLVNLILPIKQKLLIGTILGILIIGSIIIIDGTRGVFNPY